MKRFVIVLLSLVSLASAKPAFLSVPLTYAAPLVPATQIGINNGAPDDPEVTAAHDDERTRVANEAARSVVGLLRGRQSSSLVRYDAPPILTSSAPLGADGRVVDTPEVAVAKAAHATAHVNERINLANEVARSGGGALDSPDDVDNSSDGRILDASKVTATHANEKTDQTNEAATSGDSLIRVNSRVVPLVLGNGVVAALVRVGPDGRPLDVPEVVARGEGNLANDVRSVDALAVAGPALAYGRLIY
ncbi:cuticle protein 18.7 [Solenopsis invicta]|nr:cuticle protein 18.7 [Solenopsis invicta]